ncbi:MAG: nicotinamide mononucleotide transporter [Deltaproteobacteria bacterium]|nr:nicotinamide mononucleotide transporter [Deltaproteobacteria bacterium]
MDMRALGTRARIVVGVLCVIATSGLGWLLQMNPSQNTPFVDAATNVLSVIATLLMMGRYKEQWALYILLNVLSIGMWWQRYAAGGENHRSLGWARWVRGYAGNSPCPGIIYPQEARRGAGYALLFERILWRACESCARRDRPPG